MGENRPWTRLGFPLHAVRGVRPAEHGASETASPEPLQGSFALLSCFPPERNVGDTGLLQFMVWGGFFCHRAQNETPKG